MLVPWLRLADEDPVWFSLLDKRLSFRVAMLPVVLGVEAALLPCPGVVVPLGCEAPAGPFPVAPVVVFVVVTLPAGVLEEPVPLGNVALAGNVSLLKNISRLLCNCGGKTHTQKDENNLVNSLVCPMIGKRLERRKWDPSLVGFPAR